LKRSGSGTIRGLSLLLGLSLCAGALFFLFLSGNVFSPSLSGEKPSSEAPLQGRIFFPLSRQNLEGEELCSLEEEALPEFLEEEGEAGLFLWQRYCWLSPDIRSSGKLSVDAEEPPLPPVFPPGGVAVLLLDDVGNSASLGAAFAALKIPLTWAILPGESQTERCRDLAEAQGIPYIVHMPMQALGDTPGSYWYGTNWIVEGMSPEEIRREVLRALKLLPGALGMNNHRGSLATTDAALMDPFLETLRARGLFFLDSRTNSRSVAASLAAEKGMPRLENHVFLDHKKEPEFFRSQMKRLFAMAGKRGWAVGICHARSSTYQVFKEMEGELAGDPRLITLPDLVDILKGRGRSQKKDVFSLQLSD